MTDNEFDKFLENCFQELKDKQNILFEEYNLGKFDEYWFDQEMETLQLKEDGDVRLEFNIVPVGSWSGNSNTWQWAWANKSITEELRNKSLKIKELFEHTGFNVFENEACEADEPMAHELTSMAVHHLNAMGMYIVPSGNLKIFLALIDIRNR